MRADILEVIVAPCLGTPAPWTKPHRIHHAAAAPPIAAGVELESLWRLERLGARVLVCDVPPAPRAERRRIRHHPAAVRTFGVGLALRVAPLEAAPAARAEAPEPLQLGVTAGAPQLGGRDLAAAHRASGSAPVRGLKALYVRPDFAGPSASSLAGSTDGSGVAS